MNTEAKGVRFQYRALPHRSIVAMVVFAFALSFQTLVFSEEFDLKQGKLNRLTALIGTYRYGEVLSDPDVDASDIRVEEAGVPAAQHPSPGPGGTPGQRG